MNKEQLLETIREALGLETIKEAEGFIKEVDAMMVALANGLNSDEKAKVGKYLTIVKKHSEAKSGVSKIGGVEKPWTTEAKDTLKVKVSKTLIK